MRKFSSFAAPGAFVGIFSLDRLTKTLAIERLKPVSEIPLLPFFHLTYVENTGAAFGMGRSRNGFFIVLTAALLTGVFYLRRKWGSGSPWARWGLLAVAAGAAGNLYDRIVYGHVIDFLDFRVWPVFNVADSSITVGAACLAWGLSRTPTNP